MAPGRVGCLCTRKNMTDRQTDMDWPIRCSSLEEHQKTGQYLKMFNLFRLLFLLGHRLLCVMDTVTCFV
jgi:hypothetical protein